MCKHNWVKVNDICVCSRCGMTRLESGKILLFDRRLPNYKPKKRKVRRKNHETRNQKGN